ncbi:hypothetical protein Ddc_24583 [Ditylenchus destructor]|nr:hypothetical protein Ddc_24583 [Ditylenchus destructor]
MPRTGRRGAVRAQRQPLRPRQPDHRTARRRRVRARPAGAGRRPLRRGHRVDHRRLQPRRPGAAAAPGVLTPQQLETAAGVALQAPDALAPRASGHWLPITRRMPRRAPRHGSCSPSCASWTPRARPRSGSRGRPWRPPGMGCGTACPARRRPSRLAEFSRFGVFMKSLKRRLAVVLGATAMLAACGGGGQQIAPLPPTRIITFGDETSAIRSDGTKYTVNGVDTTTSVVSCKLNPVWTQSLAAYFVWSSASENPRQAGHPDRQDVRGPGRQGGGRGHAGRPPDGAGRLQRQGPGHGPWPAPMTSSSCTRPSLPGRATLGNAAQARGEALGDQDMGLTPFALKQKASNSDTDRAALIRRALAPLQHRAASAHRQRRPQDRPDPDGRDHAVGVQVRLLLRPVQHDGRGLPGPPRCRRCAPTRPWWPTPPRRPTCLPGRALGTLDCHGASPDPFGVGPCQTTSSRVLHEQGETDPVSPCSHIRAPSVAAPAAKRTQCASRETVALACCALSGPPHPLRPHDTTEKPPGEVPMKSQFTLVGVALAAALLSACGGGSNPSTDDAPPARGSLQLGVLAAPQPVTKAQIDAGTKAKGIDAIAGAAQCDFYHPLRLLRDPRSPEHHRDGLVRRVRPVGHRRGLHRNPSGAAVCARHDHRPDLQHGAGRQETPKARW